MSAEVNTSTSQSVPDGSLPKADDSPPKADKSPPKADEYALPTALKLVLDVSNQQAAAFSTVMGLCAAALSTLGSRLGNSFIENDAPAAWNVLRFFLHSALLLNISGAFMCLAVIKMCSDLQLTVYQKQQKLKDRKSPQKILGFEDGNKRDEIPRTSRNYHEPGSVSQLLWKYHMSDRYWLVNLLVIIVSALAWLFTFVTLSLWVCLSQPIGWVTMILFSFVALAVTFVCFVTYMGQYWS